MQTKRQRAYYILADLVSTSVAWLAFNVIRYFTLPYNYEKISILTYLKMPVVLMGQAAFPVMMVLLFAISGYYNKVFFKSRLDDLLNAGGISLLGSIIIFFTALFNDKIDDRLGNFEIITILWLLMTTFATIPRLAITRLATKKIWNREIAFKSIIVGCSPRARALAKDLEDKHRNMGFKIVGFIDPVDNANCANICAIDELPEFMKEQPIDSFIIVPDRGNASDTIPIINKLLPLGKSVYMTPDTYHYITMRPRTAMVAGQVLIDVSHADIPSSTVNLKRLGDIFFSSLALVALLPAYAIIAACVKFDSKGPVFYKQERIGYKKKPFYIYKFRSMRTDAETHGPALSSADDPRITPVGRVLRKYRLDELPQFWNVLKGEMSLIGPRPEREYYLNQIVARAPYYNLVHQVRPGLTSWGMVKYGYASSVDEMIERMQYDLLYVENVSFAIDLKILFYTIHTVITGKGV